ncbi:MAG: 4'-phosphopantetheinyl transferase superfamily protein [Hyphomicrobium sp.]|uniref:4'-phosphopantetheinyl transferase family protein n=1 Tax=Hyphomicrobium sp. TaxID=82 RepID=UPI003D0DAEF2
MAETELWRVDLETAGAALEAMQRDAPRLSAEELRRLGAIANEEVRRERSMAYIALRILLERRIGPAARETDFVRSPSGRPALADGAVAFSLAHTQGLALIALGNDPIGVDVERARDVRIPEARRGPIESEAVALAGGTPLCGEDADARFVAAWVRIEAAAKAVGTGVGPALERLRPERWEQRRGPGAQNAAAPPVVVHDVVVADGVFAAIALAPGETPPPLRALPQSAPAIAALLIEGTSR